MNEHLTFVASIGHALATLRFYDEGHPTRERAFQASFEQLCDLLQRDPYPRFTFMQGDALYHRQLLRDLDAWGWGRRLEAVGIQRLEFVQGVSYDEYVRFLQHLAERLAGPAIATANPGPPGLDHIRFGSVSLRDADDQGSDEESDAEVQQLSLDLETDTIDWINEEVRSGRSLPIAEAEIVVRSLALAIHHEGKLVLPLLRLRDFDQYTITHSCNVAVLTTALAEHLGFEAENARALGVAGLLHDIGKLSMPRDVLEKEGLLTPEERLLIETHPVEGARLILERESDMDLAALVAYEHHLRMDGTGYPALRYPRRSHYASRLVQVCDVFDALCSRRPYRPAFSPDVALDYIEEGAGTQFDPVFVQALSVMVRDTLVQFVPMPEPSGPGTVVRSCHNLLSPAPSTPSGPATGSVGCGRLDTKCMAGRANIG